MGWRDLGLVLALFAGYLGLAAWLPPLDDELYYWCWSQHLQWSYYDHPAMTAVWIRASTELLGNTVFAIRLPACLAMTGVFAILLNLTRPKSILLAVLFTPAYTLGAILITPDTPLLFFWAAYLRWLVAVHRRLQEHREPRPLSFDWFWLWIPGGVLLGAGVLGKYTMGLAGICGFASFCLLGTSRIRGWLAGFFLHGVVSLAVASPILIFNLEHDFRPLLYQWGHAMSDDVPGLMPVLSFIGIQVLLMGTLPLVLLYWTLRHWRELTADPRLRVCVSLFALPLLFFLCKATRGSLEGNWALASYLGFWPLAGVWWERCQGSSLWQWLTRAAFAIPGLCVLVVLAHMIYPLPFVPTKNDRLRRPIERLKQYHKLQAILAEQPVQAPVFVPTYQLTAALRFYGTDARQMDDISRPSHFTQTPDRPEEHPVWYWFAEFPLPEKMGKHFPAPKRIAEIPLTVRGESYVDYTLWEYRSPKP